MANDIKHKDLFDKLGNIKKVEDWTRACDGLRLRVCRGGRHPVTIRDPKLPDDTGRASLITVLPYSLHKRMNQVIFKEIRKFGIDEEEIWKALGWLK